jgi:glycosyltransferase 2 family protein
LALGVGLILYLVRSRLVDLHGLSRLASAWPASLAALSLLLLDLALMSFRLSCLFRAQQMHLSWSDSLQLTSVSSFFATFMPGRAGGDVAKVFYASKENPGRRMEIVAILLFDRAIGLFSLLLLPLLIAPWVSELLSTRTFRAAYAIAAVLALVMVGGFLICILAAPAVRRVMQRPGRFLAARQSIASSLSTIAAFRHSLPAVAGALSVSLADNLMGIGVVALALHVVAPGGLTPKLVVLVPIGQIVNCVPLTPGGLGIGETAFHELFSIAGMRGGAAALLCWRIWNGVIGLLGLIVYLRGFRARIPRKPFREKTVEVLAVRRD